MNYLLIYSENIGATIINRLIYSLLAGVVCIGYGCFALGTRETGAFRSGCCRSRRCNRSPFCTESLRAGACSFFPPARDFCRKSVTSGIPHRPSGAAG